LTPDVATAPENRKIMDLMYTGMVEPLVVQSQKAAHEGGVKILVAQGVPQAVAEAKVPLTPLDFSQQDVRTQVIDAAAPEIAKALGEAKGYGESVGSNAINDTSFLVGADPRLTKPFLSGFTVSTIIIYWLALSVVLLAFVLSLFFKTPTLRAKSALQEAADDKHAKSVADAAEEDADRRDSQLTPVI
jgi:hypothetical protein